MRFSKFKTKLTAAHHVALMIIVFGALAIGAWLAIKSDYNPDIELLNIDVYQGEQDIVRIQNFIGSIDSPDIKILRERIGELENELREKQFQFASSDKQFVDSGSDGQVEALLGLIARFATNRNITITENRNVVDPASARQFKDLISHELSLSATFPQVYGLLQDINALPYRVMVLSLDVQAPTSLSNRQLPVKILLSF
jgi:hypothetical protein